MKIASLVIATALIVDATPALSATIAQNSTIVSNSGGTMHNYGQSFTVVGTGSFDNIVANLYKNGAAFASGELYIFSSAYTGIVANLATTTTNRVGVATAVNNLYTFSSSVSLTGGSQYFFYTDNLNNSINFNSLYTDGVAAQAPNRSSVFSPVSGSDINFLITGNAVVVNSPAAVPEPATWAMMLIGFSLVAGASRYRRKTVKASLA